MNTACSGRRRRRHLEVGLERIDLAAEAVAAHRDVDSTETALIIPAVEHLVASRIIPAQVRTQACRPPAVRQRLTQAGRLEEE